MRPKIVSNVSTHKPRIIFIGALPPPYMGPTLATQVLLQSRLREEFDLIHLDTSDHRDIDTLGALDPQNFYLALRAYARMLKLLVLRRPDLVYVPISQTTIGYLKDSIFIILGRIFRRPVVCHLRGGNFANWLATVGPFTRWYVHRVHHSIAVQIVLGQTLKPIFNGVVPLSKLHVVPNGKDIQPGAKPRSDGKVRLLYLGNMIRTKGVLDALHAVPIVYRHHPDTEFLFCGSWEEPDLRLEIETYIAAHPELPIRWLGPLHGKEKQGVLDAADIFVFPTYYPPEGHPWVIVEAMASGLPVISTNQGAIPESIIDGVNGYIIAKQDPKELASKAIALVADPELRRRMGAASRRLYEAEFTEQRMIERMAVALKAALGSR